MTARRLLYLGCVLLLLIVLAANFVGFEAGWHELAGARFAPLVPGVLALALAYMMAALSYTALAFKRLSYISTLIVQVASGFTNRLLPAGLGGIGLFVFYFKKRGHSLAEASAVAAANNFLGFVGCVLLVTATVIIRPQYIRSLQVPQVSLPAIYSLLVLAAALAGAAYWLRQRRANRRSTLRSLAAALHKSLRPGPAGIALASNMALTAALAVCLGLSLAAVGWQLPWPAALIALSAGTLIGTAVPAPGGLGTTEAGLFGALVALGTPAATAAAGVLIYRFLTFWLPIVPGIIAFSYADRHYLRPDGVTISRKR